MKKQSITFVTPKLPSADYNELARRLNFKPITANSMQELFSMLSNPKFHTDLIVFDLPGLYQIGGASVFDVIRTITTLSRCSSASDIILAIAVKIGTNTKLIKEALHITDVKGIVPCGPEFSIDEKEECLRELLDGRCCAPKKILDKINPVKKSKLVVKPKPTNKIELTDRQAQVLRLICERGASNKAIAKTLDISESTVKLHITGVLKKYGVRNRTQLALFAKKDLESALSKE